MTFQRNAEYAIALFRSAYADSSEYTRERHRLRLLPAPLVNPGSGDEVVVSQLDHDLNVRPCVQATECTAATLRALFPPPSDAAAVPTLGAPQPPHWQWVGTGVRQRAAELGMNYVEYNADNDPGKQLANIRAAATRGVSAIVIGPVSSDSTGPVMQVAKQNNISVAFAGVPPMAGSTDYTSAVTANNLQTGIAEGKFICDEAKNRGSNKVGMLSLPLDRDNAQKYLKGAQQSFQQDGCDLVQTIQSHGLTVREAVQQANDLLTAHPDITGIYGMYDEAGTGAANVLQSRGLVGKIAVATADGSPTTIDLLRKGIIQGLFLQEAVGQGIDSTTQLNNAMIHTPVTKDLPLNEPLVTTENANSPDIKQLLQRVYPPSAGSY